MRTWIGLVMATVLAGSAFASVAAASGAFGRDFAAVVTVTRQPAPAARDDEDGAPDAACGPVEVAAVM